MQNKVITEICYPINNIVTNDNILSDEVIMSSHLRLENLISVALQHDPSGYGYMYMICNSISPPYEVVKASLTSLSTP